MFVSFLFTLQKHSCFFFTKTFSSLNNIHKVDSFFKYVAKTVHNLVPSIHLQNMRI